MLAILNSFAFLLGVHMSENTPLLFLLGRGDGLESVHM